MSQFKVNDLVRVVRKIPDMEKQGWAYWNATAMDKTVGMKGRVTAALEKGYGVSVMLENGDSWYYAPDALELIPTIVTYPIEFKPLLDAAIAVASVRREHNAQKKREADALAALEKERNAAGQGRYEEAQKLSAAQNAFEDAVREAAKL